MALLGEERLPAGAPHRGTLPSLRKVTVEVTRLPLGGAVADAAAWLLCAHSRHRRGEEEQDVGAREGQDAAPREACHALAGCSNEAPKNHGLLQGLGLRV